MADDFNFDDFDGGIDDFDMGGDNSMEDNGRNPIGSTFTELGRGTISGLTSPSNVINALDQNLPDSFSQTTELARSSIEEVSSIRDEITDELAPAAASALKEARDFLPGARLKGFADKFIDKFGESGSAYRGPSAEQVRDDEVGVELGKVFSENLKVSLAQQAEEKAGRAESEAREISRFQEQLIALKETSRFTAALAGYQDKVTFNYHKKSLEVSIRSMYFLRDITASTIKYQNESRVQLETLVKNTGLPDSRKLLLHDRVLNTQQDELQNALYGAIPGVNVIPQAIAGAGKAIKGKLGNLRDNLVFGREQAEAFRDTSSELTQAQKANLVGSQGIAGVLLGRGSKALASKLSTVPGAGKTFDSLSEYQADGLRNIRKASMKLEESERKGIRGLATRSFGKLLGLLPGESASSTKLRAIESPDTPRDFDKRTHNTINVVIPRHLAMVVKELRQARLGEHVPVEHFDYDSQTFITNNTLSKRIESRLKRATNTLNIDDSATQAADAIIGKNDVSDTTRSDLEELIRYRAVSGAGKGKRLTTADSILRDKEALNRIKDPKRRKRVQKLISRIEGTGKGDKVRSELRDAFSNINVDESSLAQEIDKIILMNGPEMLLEQGIIEPDGDNGYKIIQDKAIEMFLSANDGELTERVKEAKIKQAGKPSKLQKIQDKFANTFTREKLSDAAMQVEFESNILIDVIKTKGLDVKAKETALEELVALQETVADTKVGKSISKQYDKLSSRVESERKKLNRSRRFRILKSKTTRFGRRLKTGLEKRMPGFKRNFKSASEKYDALRDLIGDQVDELDKDELIQVAKDFGVKVADASEMTPSEIKEKLKDKAEELKKEVTKEKLGNFKAKTEETFNKAKDKVKPKVDAIKNEVSDTKEEVDLLESIIRSEETSAEAKAAAVEILSKRVAESKVARGASMLSKAGAKVSGKLKEEIGDIQEEIEELENIANDESQSEGMREAAVGKMVKLKRSRMKGVAKAAGSLVTGMFSRKPNLNDRDGDGIDDTSFLGIKKLRAARKKAKEDKAGNESKKDKDEKSGSSSLLITLLGAIFGKSGIVGILGTAMGGLTSLAFGGIVSLLKTMLSRSMLGTVISLVGGLGGSLLRTVGTIFGGKAKGQGFGSKLVERMTKGMGKLITKIPGVSSLVKFGGPVAGVVGAATAGWEAGSYIEEKFDLGSKIGGFAHDLFHGDEVEKAFASTPVGKVVAAAEEKEKMDQFARFSPSLRNRLDALTPNANLFNRVRRPEYTGPGIAVEDSRPAYVPQGSMVNTNTSLQNIMAGKSSILDSISRATSMNVTTPKSTDVDLVGYVEVNSSEEGKETVVQVGNSETIQYVSRQYSPKSPVIMKGDTSNFAQGPNAKFTGMHPAFVEQLMGMAAEYGEITGERLVFRSGYRNHSDQLRMKREYKGRAATPGNSTHQYGLGFDGSTIQLDRCEKLGLMRKYGLTRPIQNETWHVEPIGIQFELNNIRARGLEKYDPNSVTELILSGYGRGGGGLGSLGKGRKGGYKRSLSSIRKAFNKPIAVKEAEVNTSAEGLVQSMMSTTKITAKQVVTSKTPAKKVIAAKAGPVAMQARAVQQTVAEESVEPRMSSKTVTKKPLSLADKNLTGVYSTLKESLVTQREMVTLLREISAKLPTVREQAKPKVAAKNTESGRNVKPSMSIKDNLMT